MSASTGYYLPPGAAPKLEALVSQIEANPGQLVDTREMHESCGDLNVRAVMESLPEDLSEEDFVGILKLAMLTECATDSYSAVFQEGARRFDAPWLARFNDNVWTPDEHTHYTPYKYMLLSLGYSEEDLLGEMREVQERHYAHCCGFTPVELTAYGVIQEYLTDNWHGMISRILRTEAPYAARSVSSVKRRETLHTVWYREMTALQVEENPEMLGMVADTILTFQMPGTSLAPHLGSRALEWMGKVNMDFARVARDLVRNFHEVAGTTKRTGRLFVDLAARRNIRVGPVPLSGARRVLNLIGGPGYGLVGEAVLDRFGIPRPEGVSQAAPVSLPPRLYEAFRSRMRDMVASRIHTNDIIGEV